MWKVSLWWCTTGGGDGSHPWEKGVSGATGLPVLSDVCNVQHPVIAKIFELVTNFLISHKNEARSCLGSVWCILVLKFSSFTC